MRGIASSHEQLSALCVLARRSPSLARIEQKLPVWKTKQRPSSEHHPNCQSPACVRGWAQLCENAHGFSRNVPTLTRHEAASARMRPSPPLRVLSAVRGFPRNSKSGEKLPLPSCLPNLDGKGPFGRTHYTSRSRCFHREMADNRREL